MKLSKLLAVSLLSGNLSLSACATYKVSDWQASVTLPASQDCYSFNVVSGKETRLPAESQECIEKKRRSVWIDSRNYLILRRDIFQNCQFNKCKQIVGAFDDLFLTIDKALLLMPKD